MIKYKINVKFTQHILLGHPHVIYPETFDFHMGAFCSIINVHKNNTSMMIPIKFQINCNVIPREYNICSNVKPICLNNNNDIS